MAVNGEELLERIRGRAEQVEVFTASSDVAEVRWQNGAVKGAVARESSGVAVRAIAGGRIGFSGSRDLSPRGLERLVEHVESSLAVGDPARARIRFPGAQPPAVGEGELRGHDAATAALGIPDLVALGNEVLARLVQRHPGIVFDASARRSQGVHALVNSAGARLEERGTSVSIGVEANRTRDEDVLMDYAWVGASARAALDPAALVEQLSQRLTWAAGTVPLRPGRMPVLFDPEGSLVLWSPLLAALGGRCVMHGTSPLRERVGQAVLDERVTLVDDPLLPGALGSSRWDDEGLPRRRTPLIERGVLRSFVHDLESAEGTGQAPTGHGERGGVLGQPGPGFTNLVVDPGTRTAEEMIAGIEYGLLVHSVIGMGQGNTLPGTFSNPVDVAYLIEGGRVVGRVKDVSIAGNVYQLLGKDHLAGFSRETRPVYGSMFLPWVRIDGVNVVGKGT